MSTCTITPIDGLPACILWYATRLKSEDISQAFRTLNALIDRSPRPVYVFVDLRQQPQFPLTDILRAALEGPFRNPKLAEWLVIGSTPMAQIIGRTLSAVTLRKNIRYFETEDAAKSYLYKCLRDLT